MKSDAATPKSGRVRQRKRAGAVKKEEAYDLEEIMKLSPEELGKKLLDGLMAPPPQDELGLCHLVRFKADVTIKKEPAPRVGQELRAAEPGPLTALHIAARNGQAALVATLLEFKASTEDATDTGLTPLIRAVMFRKPRVVAALVHAKASVNVKDSAGLSAMDHAWLIGGSPNGPQLDPDRLTSSAQFPGRKKEDEDEEHEEEDDDDEEDEPGAVDVAEVIMKKLTRAFEQSIIDEVWRDPDLENTMLGQILPRQNTS